MTNFYMGSLRYSPCGRKRRITQQTVCVKNQLSSKAQTIKETPALIEARKRQAKQYKSLMEEAIKKRSFHKLGGGKAITKNLPSTLVH